MPSVKPFGIFYKEIQIAIHRFLLIKYAEKMLENFIYFF